MADGDLAYLSGLSEHPNRAGDVSNFNPAFASPLANAIRQARAAGLPVGIASGFREAGQTGSAYDAGGNSSHTYGLASDISGLDGPNGKITNQWAQIAQANGLHNPYGVGDKAEFNHWQLPLQPLEQTPQLLASLKQAKATGNMQSVWAAAPPLTGGTAVASAPPSRPVTPTPGPTLFAGLNPAARGMRNNNPGNLEANDWTSKLPGYQGSDGRFAIFDTPQHGAAALDQNLAGYGSKGVNTPLAIASRWAPDSDNNDPNSYGAQIAKSLGVGLNDKVDMSDPATRNKITQAIGLVENGAGNSAGVRVAYGGCGADRDDPQHPAGARIDRQRARRHRRASVGQEFHPERASARQGLARRPNRRRRTVWPGRRVQFHAGAQRLAAPADGSPGVRQHADQHGDAAAMGRAVARPGSLRQHRRPTGAASNSGHRSPRCNKCGSKWR